MIQANIVVNLMEKCHYMKKVILKNNLDQYDLIVKLFVSIGGSKSARGLNF